METDLKKLLVISWAMPPMLFPRSIQVARTLMALNRLGWQSTVLCADRINAPLETPVDPSLEELYGAHYKILPVSLEIRFGKSNDALQNSWIHQAVKTATELLIRDRYSAVMTFAQPWADHLIGLKLKARFHLPWIAHFSDPWVDSLYYAEVAPKILKNWRKQERMVIAHADAIIFTNETARELVMRKYPSSWLKKTHVVSHGYDPDLMKYPETARLERGKRLRMIYAGNLYKERSVHSLLDAIKNLSHHSDLKNNLELVIIGPTENIYQERVKEMGLENIVNFPGRMSYLESLRAVASADVPIVIEAPNSEPNPFLPSKLVDYLMFRKPILALSPSSGATANLLKDLGYPIVPPDNTTMIRQAIMDIFMQWRDGRLVPSGKHTEIASHYNVYNTTAAVDDILLKLSKKPAYRYGFLKRDLIRIFELDFWRKAIRIIHRDGLGSFIRNSVISRVRRRLRNIFSFFFYGMDMNCPFDAQWPDPKRFIPLRSISSSASQGKPSICLIIGSMAAGGSERQAASLACELKKRGYEVRVRVMNLDGGNGDYLSSLREHGIDIAVPPMPGVFDIKFMKRRGVDISLLKHLPEELRFDALALALDLLRKPVDTVHCYLDWCCCYGGFAALLSGTPCVRFSWRSVNPRNFDFFRDWMPVLYKFLLSFPHVRPENNTTLGALDYTSWLELPAGKIEVIPNGVSPAMVRAASKECHVTFHESLCISPAAPLVLSIGRLTAEKRPLDLPNIVLALRKNLPTALLVHIGIGPFKNALQERIALLGLAGTSAKGGKDAAIFLLGRRTDVFDALRASDVFLFTSDCEGMPNVVMEAMFAGVPVVSTRVGGVPDLIQDGVHGFLHDVGDIKGMAKSLERLLTDVALRQRMGNAGRERILSEFTIEQLADRVTRAYVAQCSSEAQKS